MFGKGGLGGLMKQAQQMQEKMASVTAGMPLPPGMKFPF